jgi:hypothetical protein
MGTLQRSLLQNTQQSQETDFHVPAGFQPAFPAGGRIQTYDFDRVATGIGKYF